MPSLLRNEGGNKQNWIKIKLVGTKCNRTAIGARVRVITGKHTQMDEVHSGTSVMSQSDLRLHFGLGKVETVDLIEVKWPTTQKIERFTQVKANQIITIREGDGMVKPRSLKSSSLQPGAPHLARFSRDVGYHGTFPRLSAQPKIAGRHRGIAHLAECERDIGHPWSATGQSYKSKDANVPAGPPRWIGELPVPHARCG